MRCAKLFQILLVLGIGALVAAPAFAATVTPGGTTPYAWYRADVGVVATGTTVTSWTDQSGNVRNVTANGDPQLTNNGEAGQQTVTFDGDTDSFTGTKASWGEAATGTVFAVWQRDADSSSLNFVYDSETDEQRQWLVRQTDTNSVDPGGAVYVPPASWTNHSVQPTDTIGAGNWVVTSTTHTTGVSDAFEANGTAIYTGDLLSGGMSGLNIGAVAGSTGSLTWKGEIAELIVYEGALSAAEHVAVTQVLMDRWSVVPEPGSLVLLTAGLFGLLAYAWRKRK